MSIKESYDNYNESYNNIIKVLTDILDSKEVTEGSQALLEEAYVDYNTDYTNAISVLHGQKWEEENKKIKELEYKKLDANVENILNVLTKNGMYNSIYTDEEGRILIDMQSIPKLTLLVQKLSLIAKGLDGDDESSITIAPEFIELLSNSDIILRAKNILLEGLVTANGNFKILSDGSIEATNANITGEINATSGKISSDLEVEGLNVSGTLTADSLNVRQLNCGDLNGVVSDVALVVDSTIDTSNVFENNGKFSSLQRAIESIPKNLNGYTVSIEVNSILYENITIKGFNGGTLYIKFNKNNCGYIFGHNCGAELLLQGTGTTSQILVSNYKTTGNVNMRTGGDVSYNIVQTVPTGATLLLTNFNSNGWGYTTYNGKSGWMSTNTSYMVKEEVYQTSGTSTAIQPSELLTQDGKNYAAVFRNCPYVALFDLEVYGKTGNASNYAIGSIRGSYVDIENSKICGSENGMLASRGGRIFESNVNGKVNKIAQKAELSGMIYINDGTTINGTTSKDSSSQVIYSESGAVQDTTSNVGTNTNTTTATTTVTITSTGADTYRSTMYNNYKQDNTARQGNYGWGDCNGLWLFGSKFTQLKGKTITKLTVTVNRIQGGIYGNVTATLKMHGYSTKPSGMPTYTSGWSTSITTPINTTKTIEITDATVLNAISNGTCKGFGVQGAYDSSHYAVFDGNCTLTATIQ
ncbi:MAG: SH3 domain-containing protein [Clostridium sp.]